MVSDSNEPSGGWGLGIGRFIDCHPDWLIRGAAGGFGWSAQRRGPGGRPGGPLLESLSLDELAAKIREAD
jgi:hypothetical protein